MWADFSEDFEDGMRKHAEAVKDDFYDQNDVTDIFEPSDPSDIGVAVALRIQCYEETIQALGLH